MTDPTKMTDEVALHIIERLSITGPRMGGKVNLIFAMSFAYTALYEKVHNISPRPVTVLDIEALSALKKSIYLNQRMSGKTEFQGLIIFAFNRAAKALEEKVKNSREK